ncbi:MAG: GNAT family N-acetyltransferase [Rhizobiales bacterium]|nr:GNAT family N-acetyltransferase [Hyphomicrobiales bacterium]
MTEPGKENRPRIRPVVPGEHARWLEMFEAYAAFYRVTLPEGAAGTVWGWIADAGEPFWCDVAEAADGRLVGLVQYQLMHRSLGGGHVVYLSDLYVEPGIRGGGTGRALIEHVIAFARARGIANVRWLTQEFNYPARTLYDTFAPKSDFILYSVPTGA